MSSFFMLMNVLHLKATFLELHFGNRDPEVLTSEILAILDVDERLYLSLDLTIYFR